LTYVFIKKYVLRTFYVERWWWHNIMNARSATKSDTSKWFIVTFLKVVAWEDPELTFSHGHTKATTAYRTILSEKDLKTSRTDLPQLKL